MALAAISLAEFGQRVSAGVRRRGDIDVWQVRDRRQDLGARNAEAGDTETKWPGQLFALASFSRVFVYSFQSPPPGTISEITRNCGNRFSALLLITCGGSFPSCTSL